MSESFLSTRSPAHADNPDARSGVSPSDREHARGGKIPILLDCDPGHDDAVAILLAAGCPDVELLGITTVAGNTTLERTTRNACAVATVAGIDVPVAAGCDRPLLRELRTAPEIHGESGLDGPPTVEPVVSAVDAHAVDLLVETIMDRPGKVTLVATGPLTNVALALRLEPRLTDAVRQVVVMGGAAGRGNVTPAAEFNIFADPEAAAIVFGARWPLTMVGLDVTHQALFDGPTQARIEATGDAGRFVGQLMDYYRGTNRQAQEWPDPPVHDPVAMAFAIDPSFLDTAPATVVVETSGSATTGMTVVDFLSGPAPTAARDPSTRPVHQVATNLRVEAFWDLVVDSLENIASRAALRSLLPNDGG